MDNAQSDGDTMHVYMRYSIASVYAIMLIVAPCLGLTVVYIMP